MQIFVIWLRICSRSWSSNIKIKHSAFWASGASPFVLSAIVMDQNSGWYCFVRFVTYNMMCMLPSAQCPATLLLVILPAPIEPVDRSGCNYSQNINFLVHFTVADVSNLAPQITHGFLYWFVSSKLLLQPLKPSCKRVFQFCISTMKLYQVGYIFIYYLHIFPLFVMSSSEASSIDVCMPFLWQTVLLRLH